MFYSGELKAYVDSASSGEPTPGGGSVAALVGALGGALTNMVHELSIDKKAYKELSEDIRKDFEAANGKIVALRDDLTKLIDEDTKAFDKVMEAFGMPKGTEEEIVVRSQAIQDGYKVALDPPLRTATKCVEIMREQDVLAEYGNKNAITDVGVGILLAYAATESALFNVIINLNSIKDEAYNKDINAKVDSLMKEAKEHRDKNLKVVYSRLGR